MRKVILDTNAYSRILAGEEDVLDALSDTETVYMSGNNWIDRDALSPHVGADAGSPGSGY